MASTMMVLVLLIGLGACFTQGSPIASLIRNRLPDDPSTQLLKTKFELEFFGSYKLKSYYAGISAMDYEFANKFCQSIGMSLVSIGSDQERIFLHENAKYQKYWTSGIIEKAGHWESSGKEITVPVSNFIPTLGRLVFDTTNALGKDYEKDLVESVLAVLAYPLCQI